ncbi:MAG: hypothetical protein HY259_02890 [Chloroflexi bacterium]|nr:hypothetical protein [Chloroflexota bacterium]
MKALIRRNLLWLAALAALSPAVVWAHEGGPKHNYEVLLPGETLGLVAVLAGALAILGAARRGRAVFINRVPIAGLALALLSGVLLYLSFPPFDVGGLAWVALVPMILAQLLYDKPASIPRSAMGMLRAIQPANLYPALTLFVAYTLVFMHVFPPELPTGFPIPVWPLIVLGIGLVCIVLYLTGLPGGSMAFHQQTGFRFFIIGPALGWMGMEMVRVIVELGQGWARIPTTQHANIPLIQLATAGGPWLIGALVIAANYALALLIYGYEQRRQNLQTPAPKPHASRMDWRRLRGILGFPVAPFACVTLLIVAGAHIAGYMLIGTPSQTVRVAAVQVGEDLGDSPVYFSYWLKGDWQGMDDAVLADFEPMIREAGARGAKVIALPEAVLWVDPAANLGLVARLTNLAKEVGAYITFTFYLWNDPNSRNEVYTATPRGEWLGPYAKNHPIAYIGEYSVTAGQFPVYQTPFGGLSNFVCYDNAYTDVASRLAAGGASLLTSSNHDWPEGAWGFYTQAILRATENRLAIVRADWRVGSAIIDPFGRVLTSAPWDERKKMVLVADVPVVLERGTVYTRTGDWIAYIGLAVLGAMLLRGTAWPRRLLRAPAVA